MRRGVTTPSEPITIHNRKNSTATNHNHNNINNQYDHSNSDKRRIDHNNNHNDEDDDEDDDDIIINNNNINHHHSHYHDNDNNHDHSIDHILYNRRNTTPINNNHNNNNNDNNDELNRSLHNPLLDDELNRSLHKLTVGGLPSIRRERRYMVSNGNNEFGGHHHEYYQRKSATGVSMGLSAMAIREDERSGIFSTASRSINRGDDDDDDSSSHFGIGIPIRRGYDNSHRDDYDDMDGMERSGFRRHDHNIGIMSMARSLPVPRAPFLASRNDEDQLSR